MNTTRRVSASTSKAIFSLIGLVVIVLLLFPVYWMVVTALVPSSEVLSEKPPIIPGLASLHLQAFSRVFRDSPVGFWLINSVIVTFGACILSMFVSVLAGYSLSRFRSIGQQFMGFVLLFSRMLPGTLLVIPMYIVFAKLRLINSFAALILANVTTIIPFCTWMMRGFFDSIPTELEESAMVDGCSPMEAMSRIILPLSLPGLAAVTIYSAILSWNEFLFARTLMSDPSRWVVTVGIASFVGEHATDWGSLMAAAIVFIVPIFVLFFFMEPFLVSGLTEGSVKG